MRRRFALVLLAVALTGCTASAGSGGTRWRPAPDGAVEPAVSEPGTAAAPAPAPAPTPTAREPEPSAPAAPTSGPPSRGAPRLVGTFDAEAVPEASGLAASRRTPGLLWMVDDGPGTAEVWALRDDGALLGSVRIAGVRGRDTEGLAVGPCGPHDPEPCLYVGDIGDNRASREHVEVWRIREPALRGAAAGELPEEVPAEVLRLRLPGGPADAEALLVDERGVPHLLTKAADPPARGERPDEGRARLLAAPAGPEGAVDGTMVDLGHVPVPVATLPLAASVLGTVVTAADSLPGRVLVRTYDSAVEFVAPRADEPLATLATWTVRQVPAPAELQGEAIAYAVDGSGWFTVSEGSGELWFTPADAGP